MAHEDTHFAIPVNIAVTMSPIAFRDTEKTFITLELDAPLIKAKTTSAITTSTTTRIPERIFDTIIFHPLLSIVIKTIPCIT